MSEYVEEAMPLYGIPVEGTITLYGISFKGIPSSAGFQYIVGFCNFCKENLVAEVIQKRKRTRKVMITMMMKN
jgi:hypothetical protein